MASPADQASRSRWMSAFAINVERLGRDPVTSPRNRQLVEICQHVYSAATARELSKPLSGATI